MFKQDECYIMILIFFSLCFSSKKFKKWFAKKNQGKGVFYDIFAKHNL